eukprot:7307419-Pyramimonas_sp.AAC.1
MSLYCAYFHDSEGLSRRNVQMAQILGHDILQRSLPFVIGADFDVEPSLVREAFAPHKWNGQIPIPDPMVTCCNTTPGKCYDFFIVSKP